MNSRSIFLATAAFSALMSFNIAQSTANSVTHGVATPDLSALKYYAKQGNQVRFAAELARLEVFYPNWQVPTDINSVLAQDAEQDLWLLYGTDDLTALRNAMSSRMAKDSSWRPSDELLKKIKIKEDRQRLVSQSNAEDWEGALQTANAAPELIRLDDIDVIWRLAEAYANTGRHDGAAQMIDAALSGFSDHDLQKTTLQKSLEFQSLDQNLSVLKNLGPTLSPENLNMFSVELTRQLLVLASSGEPAPDLTQEMQSRFENQVLGKPANGAKDAALLGWFHSAKDSGQNAYRWFVEARMQGDNSSKTLEGALIALIKMGTTQVENGRSNREIGLELLGETWRSDENLKARYVHLAMADLYADPPKKLNASFMTDFSDAVLSINSAEGAEALGWYAFNVHQYKAARSWFEKSLSWKETQQAAYGLGVTAVATEDKAGLEDIKARFAQFERVAELKFVPRRKSKSIKRAKGSGNRLDPVVAAYRRGDHATCLKLLSRRASLSADHLQMKGWCLLGAKRAGEAAQVFAAAANASRGDARSASRYGQALASLRSGETNQAMRLANNSKLTAKQRKIVSVEVLSQRARAAFGNHDYAASLYALNLRSKLKQETRDLMILRGWANYHLGRKQRARALFASLDAQLSTRETRRALAQLR